jgi:prepilin signal peptidase PulO-like enzyme (type II secretory pathway)
MALWSFAAWPLWIGFALLVVAAVINAWTMLVHNWLSIPALLGGWACALLVGSVDGVPSLGGGLLSSCLAGVGALLVLLPVFLKSWIGAGCLKMQVAFGAWVGCCLPELPAFWLVSLGTALGLGLSLVSLWVKHRLAARKAWEFSQVACTEMSPEDTDWFRRLEPAQFPAQVALSLGGICGVVIPMLADWV